MTGRRARRTQAERRAETRQGLIEAAVALWAETPVADVSLDLLAATAGYTRGAFHGNFAGRDEFVDAVRESLIDSASTMINNSVDADLEPLAALGCHLRATVRYVVEQPAETRALVAITRYQEARRAGSYQGRVEAGVAPLADLLRRGIEAGTIRDLDVALTAGVIQAALDSLVLLDPPDDPDAVTDELVALFTAAVRA